MENITLGQIAVAVAFFVALIGGLAKVKSSIQKWLEDLLKSKFDEQAKAINEVKGSVAEIKKQLDTVDLENCKNYLVTFLAEIERGEEKDQIERQRFWEEFSHYEAKGGNSYIHRKVEELKGKGRL